MLIVLQNVLFCLLFISLVKCAARNNGLNCLYFYPKEYIEEAHKRGLADKDATMKKGKRFMIPFCSCRSNCADRENMNQINWCGRVID